MRLSAYDAKKYYTVAAADIVLDVKPQAYQLKTSIGVMNMSSQKYFHSFEKDGVINKVEPN